MGATYLFSVALTNASRWRSNQRVPEGGVTQDQRCRNEDRVRLSRTVKETVADANIEHSARKWPKRVLALPDAKTAVLDSLTSASGQRSYDHAIREFVGSYCPAPGSRSTRTVVRRYRIHLEQRHYASTTTCASQPSAGSPTGPLMPAYSVPNSRQVFGA
jgi:hypothetical protein